MMMITTTIAAGTDRSRIPGGAVAAGNTDRCPRRRPRRRGFFLATARLTAGGRLSVRGSDGLLLRLAASDIAVDIEAQIERGVVGVGATVAAAVGDMRAHVEIVEKQQRGCGLDAIEQTLRRP